jgi:hypothetical protein
VMAYTCDGCDRTLDGRRVVFTTEATDARGTDVDVVKRWITCPSCGDEVFSRIGMSSPWSDNDGRTLAYPGDDAVTINAGGFARSL